MARPLSFDPVAALDRAMILFWQRDYERVSIQDLTEALGVNRPSLYAAFGDKETLYLRVLQRYRELHTAKLLGIMRAAAPGRAALAALFERIKHSFVAPTTPPGCLLMNAMIDWVDGGPVSELLRNCEDEFRLAIRDAVAEGQRNGEISPAKNPDALARFLMANLKAISIEARASRDIAAVGDLADQTVLAL